MNAARFLLGWIARQPVTAAEALALAATDPALPVAVQALAAETALAATGRQDVTDYVEARFTAAEHGDVMGRTVPGSPAYGGAAP